MGGACRRHHRHLHHHLAETVLFSMQKNHEKFGKIPQPIYRPAGRMRPECAASSVFSAAFMNLLKPLLGFQKVQLRHVRHIFWDT